MKYYAINGSPRKKHNTATLLQKALDGILDASAQEPTVEMIHLYDLQYRGCISCFHCKRLEGKSYGKCILNDDITDILEKLSQADGIIFGSPIYFGGVTGMFRSFMERLLFPYLVYDAHFSTIAPKKMPTAFIYTMHVTQKMMQSLNYREDLSRLESFVGRTFLEPQTLHANNTYQFSDYSKYKSDGFSEPDKAAYRDKYFPLDCENAFNLGKSMIVK